MEKEGQRYWQTGLGSGFSQFNHSMLGKMDKICIDCRFCFQ